MSNDTHSGSMQMEKAGKLSINFGDVSCRLKPLSILEQTPFDQFRRPEPGESESSHSERVLRLLAGVFIDPAPAFLVDPLPSEPTARRKVLIKSMVLAVIITEIVRAGRSGGAARAG